MDPGLAPGRNRPWVTGVRPRGGHTARILHPVVMLVMMMVVMMMLSMMVDVMKGYVYRLSLSWC